MPANALGITADRQAALLARLAGQYGFPVDGQKSPVGATVGEFVEWILRRANGGSPVTTTMATADREAIQANVLQVLAEVTKYPPDMLELDMEMEADLGIDTVKQATILSILGDKYRLPREGIQLSNYPTIGHLVELIAQHALPAQPETPVVEAVMLTPIASVNADAEASLMAESDLTRQVVVLHKEPLGARDFAVADKHIWLLGENQATLKALATTLRGQGANVHLIAWPTQPSEEVIAQELASQLQDATIDILVDCSHVGTAVEFCQLSRDEAQDLLRTNGERRLLLCQALAARDARPTKVLCLTATDGTLGYAATDIADPTFGALAGFYKALRKEWPETQVRIVDFSPQAVANDLDRLAKQVLAEIECSGLGVEVGYAHGKRLAARVDERELRAERLLRFTVQDTFLITGGGTGIASHILLALAQRYPAKFIVVGRAALPDDVASLARLDEAGLEQVKQDIHDRLRGTEERVTPAMPNSAYQAVEKAIEVHRTLEQVRALGRQVVYISCDVRDYARLEAELNRARGMLGPITALIHAAGIDRSHLLEKKSAGEFRDVFMTKAQGALHLMHLCRTDPLRLVVAFSSVAGRFGNAAQLDYSAANSLLDSWVKTMRHDHPEVHALSLAWSGWQGVGMAWRNEFVRQKSEEMGLNLLDIREGAAAFIREIEQVTPDSIVILHKGLDGFVEPGLVVTPLQEFPLIDRVIKTGASSARIACSLCSGMP